MEVAVHDTIDRNDRQVETEHAEMCPKRQELRWELHGVQRGHFREDLGERNENFILCLHQLKESLQFAGLGVGLSTRKALACPTLKNIQRKTHNKENETCQPAVQ